MARGAGNRGNRGASGRANHGRAFRVFGKKKRPPGRPRKAPRPLTSALVGRSAFRTPEVLEAVDTDAPVDEEDLRVERRTRESESKK